VTDAILLAIQTGLQRH